MKVLIIGENWLGQVNKFVERGLAQNGCDTMMMAPDFPLRGKFAKKLLKFLPGYRRRKIEHYSQKFNASIIRAGHECSQGG